MSVQLGLGLAGGAGLIPELPTRGELGEGDTLPPGPYSVGLTRWIDATDTWHDSLPWVVRCGDGRAIAGHIPSRQMAEAIADAMVARVLP